MALTTPPSAPPRPAAPPPIAVAAAHLPTLRVDVRLPLTHAILDELRAAATPSTYGVRAHAASAGKGVGAGGTGAGAADAVAARHVDETVRASAELAVPLDPALAAAIVTAASASPARATGKYVATPSEGRLLLYGVGGHFAAHSDRQRSPHHWATAIVLLPQVSCISGGFTGGKLLAGGTEVPFRAVAHAQIVVIPLGTEHEVTRVESGTRVTLTVPLLYKDVSVPPVVRAAYARARAQAQARAAECL